MNSLLPFLQGTCTPYNMPVYPGARSIGGYSLRTSIYAYTNLCFENRN